MLLKRGAHFASNHVQLKDLEKKRITVVLIEANGLKGLLMIIESMGCPGSMLIHLLSRETETKFGVRYREPLRLPYFDTISFFFVVDPMHNILLGTAKHLFTLWKGSGILSGAHFESIQANIDQFITSADIGRIPHKVQSQFSFKANSTRRTLQMLVCFR